MISFYRLGTLGRSGNILFQLAAAYTQSLRLDTTLRTPDWPGRELFALADRYIPFPFTAKSKYGWEILHRSSLRRYDYLGLGYDPKIEEIMDGTDLKGYFQSEKYFASARERINAFYTLKAGRFAELLAAIADEIKIGEAVAVHLRRGDYASLGDDHPCQPREYYEKAFSLFPGKRFVVFSDDIAAAAAMFPDLALFEFEEHIKRIEAGLGAMARHNQAWLEFFLMSKASSNIIANSSFSWWAAYLNQTPGKRVVAPSKWFGPGIASEASEYEELYPSGWLRV